MIAAPIVPAIEPAVELLGDRSVPIEGTHRGLPLGRSLSGAVVGTLLVVGLALGAALGPGGALGPASDRDGSTSGDTAAAGHPGDGDGSYGNGTNSDAGSGEGTSDDEDEWHGGPDATDKPDAGEGGNEEHPDATDKPDAADGDEGGDAEHPDATDKPDVEPTEKPDPTPKPTDKPDATKVPTEPIALGLAIKEAHPVIEWGSCGDLDFDVYKVVRSTNSSVSWPMGEGDELVAAIERGGARRAYDESAPHGDKVWYRVFCVRKGEAGYKVVNASVTKGIEVPEEPAPPTPPDPITLGLEVSSADGGKILLDWSACEVDGFAFYKVLRSTTTEDPSYLPWHEGTDVIGVIESMDNTQLAAWAPDGDQTALYRVQCIGYSGDTKVLLGESAVVAVTVP
ncbi:MAG TPA: hypothetical protein VIF63_02355 [Candidatus Limnocylindrales bacterium]